MTTRRSPLTLFGAGMLAAGLAGVALPSLAEQPEHYVIGDCDAPAQVPTFEQVYVDEARAGGEPIVETHPDGTLLWGSHAGTTHFYGKLASDPASAAFVENYEGQTYLYYSADNGETWHFVPRTPIRDLAGNGQSGVPMSGFSDPEFAVDAAGNVFASEINLANIAFSKSTDSGRSYVLQSLVEITVSDRQWTVADEEDVLYFVANGFGGGSTSSGSVGHTGSKFYKSVDGGVTFSPPADFAGGQQFSDIAIDKRTGAVYQLGHMGNSLRLFALPKVRQEMPPDVTVDTHTITASFSQNSIMDPNIRVGPEGNLYVSWAGTHSEQPGESEQGVWFTWSTDRGETWAEPQNVVPERLDDRTNIWSWMAVGDEGAVSLSWLKAETALDGHDEGTSTGGWQVWTAMTRTGLGCDAGEPGWVVSQATVEAPHTGALCSAGTYCAAYQYATSQDDPRHDRRLGDYFSHTIDENGFTVIGVTDTRKGGAVGLPLMVRQLDGPRLRTPGGSGALASTGSSDGTPTSTAPRAVQADLPDVLPANEDLPATGGGGLLAGLGAATMAFGLRRR